MSDFTAASVSRLETGSGSGLTLRNQFEGVSSEQPGEELILQIVPPPGPAAALKVVLFWVFQIGQGLINLSLEFFWVTLIPSCLATSPRARCVLTVR
jgi:hypothetical protein